MRLLFLGNSDDLNPDIPEDQRSPAITGRLLEASIGQPVEVTARVIWPANDLPDLLDRWLDRYDPDVVFFKVTWFWYGYESVPERVERLLGPVGRPFARLGRRAAAAPRIGHTRAFKAGRRWTYRLVGGDSPFTPEHVIAIVQTCIRRVLAREGTVLIVKGTATYHLEGEPMIQAYARRFASRRDHVEGSLEAFCRSLGVPWSDNRATAGREHAGLDSGDGLHKAASAQEFMAHLHARDIASALQSAGWQVESPAAGRPS